VIAYYKLQEDSLNFFEPYTFCFPGPNGLKTIISCGNRVNEAIRAINIASPVNKPKYILGINLERTRIENPIIIVIEV
jgi:hypothetical protein